MPVSPPASIHVPSRGLSDNATYTVLVINHFLSFDTEVEFFWSRKITGPATLFLTIRYLTLSWAIYGTPWYDSISTSPVRNSFLFKGLTDPHSVFCMGKLLGDVAHFPSH